MRHPFLLLGLVWAAFLVIFPFAAQGDTSYLHITAHLVQLPLLGVATALVWRSRRSMPHRAQRSLGWVLSVSVPAAAVGVILELVTAIVRLRDDGWVNRDTADVWEHGTHAMVANLTIPSLMISMLLTLVLVVTAAVQNRRRPEQGGEGEVAHDGGPTGALRSQT